MIPTKLTQAGFTEKPGPDVVPILAERCAFQSDELKEVGLVRVRYGMRSGGWAYDTVPEEAIADERLLYERLKRKFEPTTGLAALTAALRIALYRLGRHLRLGRAASFEAAEPSADKGAGGKANSARRAGTR